MRAWIATAAVALSTLAGCQSVPTSWDWPFGDDPTAIGRPEKVSALWSDTVYYQSGKPATRGVGGRLYFYDEASQAVRVEGQLVVYAFDDTLPEPERQKARKKFVFTPEQFAGHVSESDLGPSYSVWLPWDEAGGPQLQVSLLPVFTSVTGDVVAGEHARHVVPGRKPAAPVRVGIAGQQPPPAVERASFQASPAGGGEQVVRTSGQQGRDAGGTQSQQHWRDASATRAASSLRTTSIPVPPVVQQRLAHSKPTTRVWTAPRRGASGTGQTLMPQNGNPPPSGAAPTMTWEP